MTAPIPVASIPALGHDEAMRLAETEYEHMHGLLRALSPEEWNRPTECPPWDVRAMVAHLIGAAEVGASFREALRQVRGAKRLARETGTNDLDAMNELQIRERASMTPEDLLRAYPEATARALRGRRRFPRVLRRIAPKSEFQPGQFARLSLGFLMDVIYTRDTWLHRVDICRATGREMVLTAEHDGRIVADVVRDWVGRHDEPFTLTLDGPAGGVYVRGIGGEEVRTDAVEFCRVLSGRAPTDGILGVRVPF